MGASVKLKLCHLALLTVAICGATTPRLFAATLDVSSLTLMAVIQTRGEYDNSGLGTWNGQPLSPSNQPTYEEDQLSATLSFYIDPKHKNDLYLTVGNVYDTQYGYISGPPFSYVALTGIDFSFSGQRKVSSREAQFSTEDALPGEQLANGGPDGSNLPLTSTPGWQLSNFVTIHRTGDYSISASNDNSALTHFSSVSGATRIYGGAAFDFVFPTNVNLFRSIDFDSLNAETVFGVGMYTSAGELTYVRQVGPSVPEPPTWLAIGIGFFLLGSMRAVKLGVGLRPRRDGSQSLL
jgi:hypothetical protein